MKDRMQKIAAIQMEIEMLDSERAACASQEERDAIERSIQDKLSVLDCLQDCL